MIKDLQKQQDHLLTQLMFRRITYWAFVLGVFRTSLVHLRAEHTVLWAKYRKTINNNRGDE